MHEIFKQLKNEAKELSSQKDIKFYEHYSAELAYSREVFFDHPLILRCSEDVLPFLNDFYGHGVEHSKNVAIEGGAIVLAEISNQDMTLGRHLVLLVQLCGLLHDICRMEPEHASLGAELSCKILAEFPLEDKDKDMIQFAIKNHEAFKPLETAPDSLTELLSGALYDADKFRWGPDNFVTTLWEICDYQEWPLEKIIERFPQGLKFIESISETFRTNTGRIYGPEFIQVGLEMGNYLYRRMQQMLNNS